jgi:hypothetical protein
MPIQPQTSFSNDSKMLCDISLTVIFYSLLSIGRAQSDDCSSQPSLLVGSGPVATPDTPVRKVAPFQYATITYQSQTAFYALPAISDAAYDSPTPANYTLSYSNLQASSNAEGYQGWSALTSYNTTECARLCNANDRCIAFNILFERSPSVEPGVDICTDPPSTSTYLTLPLNARFNKIPALIKCVLWSGEVSPKNAINTGETRSQFKVLIAGSNGYNKLKPPPPPGYLEPINLKKYAISAPTCSNGVQTGISQIFNATNDPYNVTRAAQWCDTQYTRSRPCYFFNCYLGTYAAGPQIGRVFGQICDFYTSPWGKEYATKRQTFFDGPALDISGSFAFVSGNAPGACAAPLPA